MIDLPIDIFVRLFLVSLVVVAFTLVSYKHSFRESPPPPKYKFTNKTYALNLLNRFDDAPELKSWWISGRPAPEYKTLFLIKSDRTYCDRVRQRFVEDPNYLFDKHNLITEYSYGNSMVRDLISGLFDDVMPDFKPSVNPKDKGKFKFHVEGGVYFTHSQFHFTNDVGSEMACINQMYNHIPGLPAIQSKDKCAQYVNEYAKNYENRKECFSLDIFLPRTYLMFDRDDCNEFFDYINSNAYEKKKKKTRIQFIRKIGDLHAAQGVEVVDETEEARLREVYDEGRKCGRLTENVLVQKYIADPLLLVGRKFDFRIYMFVASTNPIIAYYHDGFLKLSVHRYDQSSEEKNSFISNTLLAKKVFDEAAEGKLFEGMNEDELRDFQTWTLDRLQKYLLEEKVIDDPNWLDNYLRPKFKQAMIHITRATASQWLKYSSVCELLGWDYTLDADLTLWFLEANWNPALVPYSESRKLLLTSMITDIFEIMFNMLRSRMKRVIVFVNKIIKEYPNGIDTIPANEIESMKDEYLEITKNRLEPEFELDPTNRFEKIMDENIEGEGRYSGYIPEKCY